MTDHIEKITPTGIQLVSGEHLDADIIVCATAWSSLFWAARNLRLMEASSILPMSGRTKA